MFHTVVNSGWPGTHCIALVGLERAKILLSQHPEDADYRRTPLHDLLDLAPCAGQVLHSISISAFLQPGISQKVRSWHFLLTRMSGTLEHTGRSTNPLWKLDDLT